MIYSFDLERKVLAGLLQHPKKWGQVSTYLIEDDFYSKDSKAHITIFKMVRNALNNREDIDDTILIDRIVNQNVTFPDSIDTPEYIRGMYSFKVSEEIFLSSIKELKKYTLRRVGLSISEDIKNCVTKVDPSKPFSSIAESLDKIYSDKMRGIEMGENKIVNLAEIAEAIVEDRGENPPEEVGMMTPYESVNKIYGSLFRGGNITVICARSKVGKTLTMLDMLMKTAYKYKVPVLHFDNGEMSQEELVFRMVAGNSGVPMHLLESGDWRKSGYGDWSAKEVVDRVRSVWENIEGLKILYENVAGMTGEEMVNLLKRLYYSEIGRGNPMIFSFDYLKTDFNNLGKGSDFAYVGKLMHAFKQCISRDLKFDGELPVSMITSIQANRSGITNNRSSDAIVEDESIVSLSDNVTQFSSHLFILRKKTLDELVVEGERFGTHKLINLVARHLGEDPFGHINPVEMPDGSKKNNFINFHIENFNVEDRGDLRDIVSAQKGEDVNAKQDEDYEDEIPDDFK